MEINYEFVKKFVNAKNKNSDPVYFFKNCWLNTTLTKINYCGNNYFDSNLKKRMTQHIENILAGNNSLTIDYDKLEEYSCDSCSKSFYTVCAGNAAIALEN